MAHTRKTARKSTGPQGVPRHQIAPRLERSGSGSNDPIGDLEARLEQLRSELRHRNRAHEQDGHRIPELSAEVSRLQYEISERDTAIDWAINSRSFAWDYEAKALARVAELSASLKSLQVYCNTLHEEVHVLYARLHLDVPPDVAAMGAGPSGTANEGPDGEQDLFRPLLP
jgi:chromosome segregation ATPase